MTEEIKTDDTPETPNAPEANDAPPPPPEPPEPSAAAEEKGVELDGDGEEGMAEALAEELAAEVESEIAVEEGDGVDFEVLTAKDSDDGAASAALEAAQKANWELSDKIEGLEDQIDDLNARLGTAEVAAETVEAERDALNQTVEALRAQVAAQTGDQASQQERLTQIANLEAEASRLRRAQSEKQATLDELTRRNRTLSDEIGGLTRSLAAMGDQIETIKTDRDDYKKKVDDVDRTLKKMRRRTKLVSGTGVLALLYAIIKR